MFIFKLLYSKILSCQYFFTYLFFIYKSYFWKDGAKEMNKIDNEELPIGFTMELAQHSDVLNQFSQLSKTEQQSIIDSARSVQSHNEMRHFVESLFK